MTKTKDDSHKRTAYHKALTDHGFAYTHTEQGEHGKSHYYSHPTEGTARTFHHQDGRHAYQLKRHGDERNWMEGTGKKSIGKWLDKANGNRTLGEEVEPSLLSSAKRYNYHLHHVSAVPTGSVHVLRHKNGHELMIADTNDSLRGWTHWPKTGSKGTGARGKTSKELNAHMKTFRAAQNAPVAAQESLVSVDTRTALRCVLREAVAFCEASGGAGGDLRTAIARHGKKIGHSPFDKSTVYVHHSDGNVYSMAQRQSPVNHGPEPEFRQKVAAGKIRATLTEASESTTNNSYHEVARKHGLVWQRSGPDSHDFRGRKHDLYVKGKHWTAQDGFGKEVASGKSPTSAHAFFSGLTEVRHEPSAKWGGRGGWFQRLKKKLQIEDEMPLCPDCGKHHAEDFPCAGKEVLDELGEGMKKLPPPDTFDHQMGLGMLASAADRAKGKSDSERKAFHTVLHGAGYTRGLSAPNMDLFTHPTKSKVGVLHGKVIGTSALSNGHKLDTPAKLKAHLESKTALGEAKKPKSYDFGADVRSIARERVGQIPAKKVMMPKTKKAPKYKADLDEAARKHPTYRYILHHPGNDQHGTYKVLEAGLANDANRHAKEAGENRVWVEQKSYQSKTLPLRNKDMGQTRRS